MLQFRANPPLLTLYRRYERMLLASETVRSLYDQDYQLWIEQTVVALRSRTFEHVDLENLIEEIESLGKSEKRELLSYLMRVCEHLLKLQYWEAERDRCLGGWKTEIRTFRLQIQGDLEDSPSLKNHLRDNFIRQYQNGRDLFLDASNLDRAIVPSQPCFSLEEALDLNWLPDVGMENPSTNTK